LGQIQYLINTQKTDGAGCVMFSILVALFPFHMVWCIYIYTRKSFSF